MEYDEAKLQAMVLAVLGVFEFENGRVWKRYAFSVMEALHEQGWISDPHGKHESVYLTEAGLLKAKALAAKHFGPQPGL